MKIMTMMRSLLDPPPTINRMVQLKQSPYMNVYYGPHAIQVTLDTGADTNMIHLAVKNRGTGATLYVVHDDKPSLDGFFSAKLLGFHVKLRH